METSEESLSASVFGGSDVIYDFCCEPCSTDNLNVEATGYCEQCQEYLCDNCCKYHKKSTTSKSHTVLDKAAMPKTKVTRKARDVLIEMCPEHSPKVLEYVCHTHNKLCCSVCMTMQHASCSDRSYIPDISKDTTSNEDYSYVVTQLARLLAMANNENLRADMNDKENNENLSKAISDIKACKTEMVKLLDKVVENAIQDVTRLHKENSDTIKDSKQKCLSVISDVNGKTTDLEKKAKANKNNQLFVDVKLTRLRLATIEKDIQDVSDRTFSHFKFDKDEKVQELQSLLSAMYTLSVRKVGAESEARYLQEVNVKSADDKKDCFITGIVVMDTARLVVTDFDNAAVKLIDVNRDRVLSRLSLSSPPYDVARTVPTTVAVVLGQEWKIEIVVVSDVLARSHTINVQGDGFRSLNYVGDKFILVHDVVRALKIVDMSGKAVNTVYKDIDDDPMFLYPRYITLSNNQNLVYVTDSSANTVTTMTLKGQVINVYRNDKLKYPLGVTVGRDGAVYVCSSDTDTVHQLSATGQHVKILLDQQRGLMINPGLITYDEGGNRLCVSSSSSKPMERNYVRLFLLE